VVTTDIPESWSWMVRDLLIRLVPFAALCVVVELVWRPSWMGVSAGRAGVQLAFGLIAAPVLFVCATLVQRQLARRRGALSAPRGGADAWFQAGYYAVNGPIEEAFFRGLVQGGLGALVAPPVGFLVGTAAYVLYHRLGWSWQDTLATALLGVPVGLAFWLLPGPPSLLGVSIAHIGATCGFLGPGPYFLRRLRLV
jgi:membrane protease YdiL (CAAX protease family)